VLLALLLPGCGEGTPRLALLVTVDTLRADRLSAYGSRRGLDPHLDRLARESAVFASAWAPTSFTRPSVAALLTGRHPVELGVHTNSSPLPSGVSTLATTLRESGWRTGAVVSNWILREASGLARGFEVYDDRYPQAEAARGIPERIAPATTRAALSLLDRLLADPRGGVFLWVHYQDPHGPYTPPPSLRRRFLERERAEPDGGRVLPASPDNGAHGAIPRYQLLDEARAVAFYRAGYDAEVAFVDRWIGRLLEGIRKRGLYGDAVVVFAADHGESLGEGDFWFAHGELLSDVLVRVPVFVRAPGLAAGLRRTEVVSLRDLHATLLALAGEPGEGAGRGRDLFASGTPEDSSEVYLSSLGSGETPRIGLVADGHKAVWRLEDGGWRRSPARRVGDPGGGKARPPDPESARALEAGLRERAARAGRLPPEAEPPPLGEAERRGLEALGYLDPADPPAPPGEAGEE